MHSGCGWSGEMGLCVCVCVFFFFQAEDGIRDAQESRGLGDVYKRQVSLFFASTKLFFRMRIHLWQ